jgi:GNAT superfamily N-acetyltransferase
MASLISVQDAIDELASDPLRHLVLLKHLLAFPEHVRVHRTSGAAGTAMLVALETAANAYDRQTYPGATVAALISSDHPELTAALLAHLPRGVGIVFKLGSAADLAPVAAQFAVTRRTAFLSFTAAGGCAPSTDVLVSAVPDEAAFRLFAEQGHERGWLEPLLVDGRAFACLFAQSGRTVAGCFAFENYGRVWEVGGVVTDPAYRRQGFAERVVRTALAELHGRGLAPRYQVEEHNMPSIALARSVGLAPFLTIVHYAHRC